MSVDESFVNPTLRVSAAGEEALDFRRIIMRHAGFASLTDREFDVLVRLLEGDSTKAAAARLGIAYSTAQTHLKRIYAKVGVHTRGELFSTVFKTVFRMQNAPSSARTEARA